MQTLATTTTDVYAAPAVIMQQQTVTAAQQHQPTAARSIPTKVFLAQHFIPVHRNLLFHLTNRASLCATALPNPLPLPSNLLRQRPASTEGAIPEKRFKGPKSFAAPKSARPPLSRTQPAVATSTGAADGSGSDSEATYWSVVWCKQSKKKHKVWEDDAVLITKGKTATLKDLEVSLFFGQFLMWWKN
jgi:hypothetical protein